MFGWQPQLYLSVILLICGICIVPSSALLNARHSRRRATTTTCRHALVPIPGTDLPPLPISERFIVMRDGLGMQVLSSPSPFEQEIAADKQIPLTTLIYERLFDKVVNKVSRAISSFFESSAGAVPPPPATGKMKDPSKAPLPLKPPVLFLHGSYHSSWCWEEQFFPLFSRLGYTCYAVSLRGTAPTGMAYGVKRSQESLTAIGDSVEARMPGKRGGDIQTVQIQEHVSDIKEVLDFIAKAYGSSNQGRPIIIAHSFAGIIAMKLLEDPKVREGIRGVCYLCSVPPSGNGLMTMRFLRSRFLDALKIVYGFVLKGVTFDINVARQLFFDDSFADSDVTRYMQCFKADSKVGLDLRGLASVLPSVTSTDPQTGLANWLGKSQSKPNDTTNHCDLLVLGGENDFIVDREGVIETARYCGVDPVFLPVYHDAMLGPKHNMAATAILDWLQNKILIKKQLP